MCENAALAKRATRCLSNCSYSFQTKIIFFIVIEILSILSRILHPHPIGQLEYVWATMYVDKKIIRWSAASRRPDAWQPKTNMITFIKHIKRKYAQTHICTSTSVTGARCAFRVSISRIASQLDRLFLTSYNDDVEVFIDFVLKIITIYHKIKLNSKTDLHIMNLSHTHTLLSSQRMNYCEVWFLHKRHLTILW